MSMDKEAAVSLGTTRWDGIERIVERFEEAWSSGPPKLEDFLPAESVERATALIELVHVDLEFRLKAGEQARVESYLARYPELAAQPAKVIQLIAAEYEFRWRNEAGLTPDEYLQRFPAYATELSARLAVSAPVPTAAPCTRVQPSETSPGSERVRSEVQPAHIPGYEMLGELGRGGMGVVYKARQIELKRLVALKMVLAVEHAGSEKRERFLAEAQAVARLQHPHIVQIHEIGEYQGWPFFSLEYVDGGSLDKKLARAPQPAAQAATLVETLARAMHAAHLRGIVHRDLKPANVLLTQDGTPKITDFGLAKQLGADTDYTRTGVIMGTPSYMAPEQAAGKTREIGPAADVYALGAILYEMLTGRPPFQGAASLDTLDQVRSQEPVPPSRLAPKVPRDLETICLKCLQKEPGRRYETALALADDLRRAGNSEPIRARPVSRRERLWRWCRRNPALATAMSLAVLALLSVAVVSSVLAVHQSRSADEQRRSADDLRRLADDLRDQQRHTAEALQDARTQRAEAERLAVGPLLDKGLALCEQGEVAKGLLWLARALELADRSEASADLRRLLRLNLAVWAREPLALRLTLNHQAGYLAHASTAGSAQPPRPNLRPWEAGHRAVALRPDGRAVAACNQRTARVWDASTGQALSPVLEHADTIYAVAFSADGATLVTGSNDRTAKVWDVATGRARFELTHADTVSLVAFCGDSRTLLTLSGTAARLWDLTTGKPTAVLEHTAYLRAAASSPDGKLVLTASDTMARLWEVASGKPLTAPLQGVGHLAAFGPDGKTAVTAWEGARLWEVPSGKALAVLEQPNIHATRTNPGPVWALAYSPDGKTLLTGGVQGQACWWNTTTGRRVNTLPFHGGLFTVAFRPDGKTFLTGGGEGAVRFWDAATGQSAATPLWHDATVAHAAYSGDGQTLLTWTTDGTLRLWDAAPACLRGMPVSTPQGSQALAFSADGSKLLSVAADHTAQVRDLQTGKAIGLPLKHPAAVRAAAFSPNGQIVVTDCADGSARLWDTSTGAARGSPLKNPQMGVAFTADGRQVAASNSLWDALSGARLGPFTGNPDGFVCCPDGRLVTAKSVQDTAQVIDARTGQALGPAIRGPGVVNAWALSPDGRTLLTGHARAVSCLWDAATGKLTVPRLQSPIQVDFVAYAPDGRRVLTGGLDAKFQLWDAATGAPVGTALPGPSGFSPDGQLVWTAEGKVVRLRDATTGKLVGPALVHALPVQNAALSADGKLLRAHCSDGTIRLWDVSPLPLPADAVQVTLWVQLRTGLELDTAGVARGLNATAWAARRDKLRTVAGEQ
jgi:WD40 repeat protein/serine/threonine protein kinase